MIRGILFCMPQKKVLIFSEPKMSHYIRITFQDHKKEILLEIIDNPLNI